MALGRKPIEIVNDGKHQLLAKADSWERIYLKEVAKVQNGFAFNSSNFVKTGGLPLIRIRDIDKSTTVDRYNGEYSDDFIVKKGDVLIGMDGDFKAAIWKGENALLNQRVCRIIPNSKDFDSKFLFVCLQPYLNAINEETSSVTVKHLSSRTIEEIPLPFPPLPEQQAIVAKIEELLSDLENGKQQLQTAGQQLKIYRQSLLKWAFEGKLTNKDVKDGELPKGWKWANLGEVLDKIEAGKSFKCDERTPRLDEVGVLKVSAVTWQVFNEVESKTVMGKDRINENYFVKKDDFLFSRANTLDLIGAVVLVGFIERKLMLSDKTLRFKFNSNILKKYILYYLRSRKGRKEIQRLSTGNQESMRNIGQERIKQIEFPFCTLEEQQLIVSELESKLTVCDKLEETINHCLQQAETLRQSILKKAFEGKLV